MENLKSRVGRLKGIYERSDAMLANYPAGENSFQSNDEIFCPEVFHPKIEGKRKI